VAKPVDRYKGLSEEEIISLEVKRLLRAEQVRLAWTPDHMDSRPSEAQLDPILHLASQFKYLFVLGGNQGGKTNLEVRSLTWMAEESSPYWRRPTDNFCNNKLCGAEGTLLSKQPVVLDYECPKCGNIWRVWDKDEPINILLVGEQLKNLQENLYFPRIKRLFQDPDEWEEDKLGSPFIQKVTNRKTGNSILFFPHGQGEEKARKAIQGYTVHAVFTDEQMPANVIEECQRRVDAKMGTFMMAFTMKFLDANVMRMMEAQVASGAAKMFKLSKLDNPVYAGSKDLILKQLAGLSEEKRNTVLYGDVSYGEDYIYAQVETSKIGKQIPADYSTNWRHVEVIDPAVKSKAGRLVVAQDPHTKIWHVIKAQKISGMLHDKHLYEYILKLRTEDGYNPVLCVSDDDAGFIGMAKHHERPTKFIFPPHKRSKLRGGKLFLIKQSVGCLVSGILHIDPKFTLLWDEIREYQWKEGTTTEVKASHKFHLVDTLHYFFDTLPEEEKMPETPKTWHEEILEANQPWSPEIKRKTNQLKKKPKRYIMTSGWHGIMR
jgi:phage terminase large subunit-like protein